MKKLFFLTPLFLVGFGVGLGIAFTASVPAVATGICEHCIYFEYCTTETGPLCTNPEMPYYVFKSEGLCLDGIGYVCPDKYEGCCDNPGHPW